MGLDVTVGMLAWLRENDPEGADWFREEVKELNALLVRHGLSEHGESEELRGDVFAEQMIGYSGLHHLRRYAAHMASGDGKPDYERRDDPENDPRYVAYYQAADLSGPRCDHLMLHSDADGFYVPIDFREVLVEEETAVGSSYRLREECEEVARSLELPPHLTPQSEELWAVSENPKPEGERWERFGFESFSCCLLLAAARRSIEEGALVVFH